MFWVSISLFNQKLTNFHSKLDALGVRQKLVLSMCLPLCAVMRAYARSKSVGCSNNFSLFAFTFELSFVSTRPRQHRLTSSFVQLVLVNIA